MSPRLGGTLTLMQGKMQKTAGFCPRFIGRTTLWCVFLGTAYFMAPEVIKGGTYTLMADIWSFGCAVIEMLTGKPPYSQYEHQWAAMYHISTDDPMKEFPGVEWSGTWSSAESWPHQVPWWFGCDFECPQFRADTRPATAVLRVPSASPRNVRGQLGWNEGGTGGDAAHESEV